MLGHMLLITAANSSCLFGENLKKENISLSVPIMFLINGISQECTIARFRQCALQCVQTALGLLCVINACLPLAAEDILDAPSYPCPLQFFTSNDQVWSASRIDVATASPVVRAKLTNPRNSSCILQVS